METSCQPIAARGEDLSWPAQLRDLSVGGMGVVLRRRFERGAGLAVEIPETPTSPATTLLGRVVHTTSLPGGSWLLGCAFVSNLSEDELKRLLGLGQKEQQPLSNEAAQPQPILDVTFEGLDGRDAPRLVRRLHWQGTWPPAPGKILKVWFAKKPNGSALIRIERCLQQAGRWLIFYTFFNSPSPEFRELFAKGRT
jgi:hypothetical protein